MSNQITYSRIAHPRQRRFAPSPIGLGVRRASMALGALYFAQVSVLAVLSSARMLNLALYVLLCVLGLMLVFQAGSPRLGNPFALVFVISACISSVASSHAIESLSKWAGLALVILVVGPLLTSKAFVSSREVVWRTVLFVAMFIGVASAAWYLLRLPVLGRGGFTGVMAHSMLVGPTAGLAAVIGVCRSLYRRSRWWLLAGLVCILPCVMSGSRIALASLALALGWVVMTSVGASSARKRLLGNIAIVGVMAALGLVWVPEAAVDEVTGAVVVKGSVNTRRDLWLARIAEFKASPAIGMGVGVGKGAGFFGATVGSINIEPGSGYLAILSMTGLAGAIPFSLLVASIIRSFRRVGNHSPKERVVELVAVAIYLATHAVAEGWILAVGSPFCLLAWLCLGHAGDWPRLYAFQGSPTK